MVIIIKKNMRKFSPNRTYLRFTINCPHIICLKHSYKLKRIKINITHVVLHVARYKPYNNVDLLQGKLSSWIFSQRSVGIVLRSAIFWQICSYTYCNTTEERAANRQKYFYRHASVTARNLRCVSRDLELMYKYWLIVPL